MSSTMTAACRALAIVGPTVNTPCCFMMMAGEWPIERTISSPIAFPPIDAYSPRGTSPPNSSAMAVSTQGIGRPAAANAVA